MKKWVTILVVFLLIVALVGVRVIGSHIFYDPLIHFFHSASYQSTPLPEMNMWMFSISLFFRFVLNTVITLALIWTIFKKQELIKLTVVLYAFVFVILGSVLIWLVNFADFDQYRYLFYVRRILIHPVLTLILIPAFLYNERVAKTE